MISMELAILGDIPLGVWIAILPGPSNCVTHCFHDCNTLDGIYIEGVLGNLSLVPIGRWVIIGSHRWLVKQTTVVV